MRKLNPESYYVYLEFLLYFEQLDGSDHILFHEKERWDWWLDSLKQAFFCFWDAELWIFLINTPVEIGQARLSDLFYKASDHFSSVEVLIWDKIVTRPIQARRDVLWKT